MANVLQAIEKFEEMCTLESRSRPRPRPRKHVDTVQTIEPMKDKELQYNPPCSASSAIDCSADTTSSQSTLLKACEEKSYQDVENASYPAQQPEQIPQQIQNKDSQTNEKNGQGLFHTQEEKSYQDDEHASYPAQQQEPNPQQIQDDVFSKDVEDVEGNDEDAVLEMVPHYRFVCAIDMGTSHSGYAYSSTEQFEKNPDNIVTPTWNSGKYLSKKTATCVLYSPDGPFHSFGYQAQQMYYELLEQESSDQNKADHWSLYRNFKMKLYNESTTENLMLKDQKGREKPAIDVFADALRFLKSEALKDITDHAVVLQDDDCRWVLTVPAIWKNNARQFMIKAAEKAGIPSKHLMLCLEPEAAAVLCKEDKSNTFYKSIDEADQTKKYDIGSRLLVVDLGGGTVDITCNKVLPNGRLEELRSATGGDCGGTSVDREFERFFSELIDGSYEQLKQDNEEAVMDLMSEFEMKKRLYNSLTTKIISLRIPHDLKSNISEENIKKLYDSRVSFQKDKLIISSEVFKRFFNQSINQIIDCLTDLMIKDSKIRTIILVGGFSRCREIRLALQKCFPKTSIIDAVEPDLPVMRGAVIFGHNPDVISSRISKYWYGIKLISELIPLEKTAGNFFPFIAKGQWVKVGQAISHSFRIDDSFTKDTMTISQFCCAEQDKPTNIDNSTCQRSGDAFEIYVPRMRKQAMRILTISVRFHGTELEYLAYVRLRTPRARAKLFDF